MGYLSVGSSHWSDSALCAFGSVLSLGVDSRDSLPSVALQNARATGTSPEGYFTEGHGFTTFALEEDTVYHCYSTYARGTEFLMGYYAILDRVPKGRAEGNQPASWLRRHDEYDSLLDPV